MCGVRGGSNPTLTPPHRPPPRPPRAPPDPPNPPPPRHIFLGFSKCGRFVLSYTSSSGDDEFSFYIYHLYWWEFRLHGKLRLVRTHGHGEDTRTRGGDTRMGGDTDVGIGGRGGGHGHGGDTDT